MSTQGKKNKRQSDLIPDINKIEQIREGKRKISKKDPEQEIRRAGPSTTRKEEKDPNEYPMK